jgi:hypothetical protein
LKISFFILIVLLCFSKNSEDQEVLKIVSNYSVDSIFVYAKKSDGYNRLGEIIQRKSIFNRNFPSKSITLTNQEINYLKKEIKKNKEYSFSSNLFPSAQMISNDTIESYSSNKAEKWRKDYVKTVESKDSLKIANFFDERGTPCNDTWVHFFSKPIYLRENTICILYHAQHCNFHQGLGGCHEVQVLKKNNNKWEKYIEIPIGCY